MQTRFATNVFPSILLSSVDSSSILAFVAYCFSFHYSIWFVVESPGMRTMKREMRRAELDGKRENRLISIRLPHIRCVGFDEYAVLALMYNSPSRPLHYLVRWYGRWRLPSEIFLYLDLNTLFYYMMCFLIPI